MHGRICFQYLGPLICLLLASGAGCDDVSPPSARVTVAPNPDTASAFDPATAGAIRGQVVWNGGLPQVEPILGRFRNDDNVTQTLTRANPNAPVVDPETRGVANAVVFLRGIDPKRARSWDHPPVRVEQRDYRLNVFQGEMESSVGFVRRGDPVEMVSTQPVFHSLRAAGSASFTLTFPQPDQPLTRIFDRRGVVELSSGAGYYWMRAHLFVDDHPYWTRTDAAGRFTLTQVPPGRYEVVCWLPNWHKERHERNPDSSLTTRWIFRSPVESAQLVELPASGTVDIQFTTSSEEFESKRPRVLARPRQ